MTKFAEKFTKFAELSEFPKLLNFQKLGKLSKLGKLGKLLSMEDFTNRVRGVRKLPLFPIPVVLFPGTPLPLHIFEPRYRQMLEDIQITNRLFGVSFYDAAEEDSNTPAIGHFGCVAELRDVQELPDGRSNILCIGLSRYEVESYYDEGEAYLVGEVSCFEDDDEDDEILVPKAEKVRELFGRIANSVKTLSDQRGELLLSVLPRSHNIGLDLGRNIYEHLDRHWGFPVAVSRLTTRRKPRQ